jgi:hypothetical protein
MLLTRNHPPHPGSFIPVSALPAMPESSASNLTKSLYPPGTTSSQISERERQASSLAAAGILADSGRIANGGPVSMGLRPPPRLASDVPANTASPTDIDNINWSVEMGQLTIDDMDLDFAQLFDSEQEMSNMQTEGSGWPQVSPMALEPNPISHQSSAGPSTDAGSLYEQS